MVSASVDFSQFLCCSIIQQVLGNEHFGLGALGLADSSSKFLLGGLSLARLAHRLSDR